MRVRVCLRAGRDTSMATRSGPAGAEHPLCDTHLLHHANHVQPCGSLPDSSDGVPGYWTDDTLLLSHSYGWVGKLPAECCHHNRTLFHASIESLLHDHWKHSSADRRVLPVLNTGCYGSEPNVYEFDSYRQRDSRRNAGSDRSKHAGSSGSKLNDGSFLTYRCNGSSKWRQVRWQHR